MYCEGHFSRNYVTFRKKLLAQYKIIFYNNKHQVTNAIFYIIHQWLMCEFDENSALTALGMGAVAVDTVNTPRLVLYKGLGGS